jgi:8-oxo-dGTP diphosphatase
MENVWIWYGKISDMEFDGAKLALISDNRVLTLLRDDRPDIPFPAMWDFPGGGREDDETPVQCALRELDEEFSLILEPSRVMGIKSYPGHSNGGLANYFMVAAMNEEELASIVFGDEGERWQMMGIEAFLSHPKAVPHLVFRLEDYFAQADAARPS